MTFRLRLAIAAAVAVAATVAIASGVIYVVMRDQLLKSADQQLVQQYTQIKRDPHSLEHAFGPAGGPFTPQPQGPSATSTYFQLVQDDGQTQKPSSEVYKVPVTKDTLAVASGRNRAYFANGTVGDKPQRIYTVYVGKNANNHGVAIQFVRPTDDIARTLNRLKLILLLVVAGGLAAGAAAGALVSRARRSSRSGASPALLSESPEPAIRVNASRTQAAATSWPGSGQLSTRCSARSRNRSTRKDDSWRTPLTSCAHR